MATFTLTYPKGFKSFSAIPIMNEHNETVCMLQKSRTFFYWKSFKRRIISRDTANFTLSL
ncbi:hypothetical protein OL548_27540 [Lysinibacillus sp. MHQ-1]|nr:hypothetical protein OL548_27540 [Lysinibacillus sp. MHQ-1]